MVPVRFFGLVLRTHGDGENTGDLYHTRFWGQTVQRMAGRRLATGSRRSELRSDRAIAKEGENLRYSQDFSMKTSCRVKMKIIEATLIKNKTSTEDSRKITESCSRFTRLL